MATVTRPSASGPPLLPVAEARREAEELLATVGVLYPNDAVVRTALRGAAMYELSWVDANMWAYAEVYGLSELWSEDFQHDPAFFMAPWIAGWIEVQAGKVEEAVAPFRQAEAMESPVFVSAWLAYAHGASSDRTRAATALAKPLRSEPRFAALVRKLGLEKVRAGEGR